MSKQLLTLTVLFIFLLFGFNAQSENKTALLVGIDKYLEGSHIPPLRFASADAQNMSRILSENGYNCITLVDIYATKERITEEFIKLEQQIAQTGELELFIFYFSGRGTRISDDIQTDETQDGLDECILPSDAVADNPRSYIRDDAIARWLSAIHAKQTILILDCGFFGDEANANVKGIGKLPEAVERVALDGVEIADSLPPDAIIISAAMPDARAEDGVFTTKMLEACVTEEADGNGDRVISFAEAYQYANRQLQGQQQPKLIGAKAADIPLAPLPPLSRISIESNPEGAEIQLYVGAERILLDKPQYTPAEIPLKQGMYKVQAQKPGFLIPEAKEVAITAYDTLYFVELFQLESIKVEGQMSIANTTGEPISVEGVALTIHVKRADEEIYQETLPLDGRFQFKPEVHDWLNVGSEYELNVTGQPVLAVEPVRFTYDSYTDIHISMTVTLDDVPPALSPNGVTFQTTRLIIGEELRGSVKAQDNGLGLSDNIEIQLQPPDAKESVSIPVSDIHFQSPDIYQFRYSLPETESAVGTWRIAGITVRDKAGNTTRFSADLLDAMARVLFHVYASRFALGKYYFHAKDYKEALVQFQRISPPNDDARYMIASIYYHQGDLNQALVVFQTIENKTNYLGHARQQEMPPMPQRMANKVWGVLLDNLNSHRTDAAYISLLAATAEELGRSYEARVYREYANRLREMEE